MRPVEGTRLLADPYFYPVYDEAQKLDMAIAVHIANGSSWLNDLYRHPVPIAATLHRFRIPTVAAFNDVLLSEIPPWVLHEAKNRFKTLGREWRDNIAREYRMFVTCENSDDLPYIVNEAGEDCLVVGTDYGHTDISSDIDAIKLFRQRTDLPENVKRKILSDNARALYAI